MKYVWIFVAVIILVRIDMVLNFFEKTLKKVNSTQETELRPGEVPASSDLVPINSDLTLKVTPRNQVLTILGDFYVMPDRSSIDKALELLKQHPTIFNDKLDIDLEVKIYRWREHIQQKNKLCYDFVFALMKILKGENLQMLQRFSSLMIDYELPEFLNYSALSSDTICVTSTYLADSIPDEEKYNELVERADLFQTFLSSSTATAGQKVYAEKCLNLIRFQIDKMKPLYEPSNEQQYVEPVSPEPSPTPDSTQVTPGISP